MLPLQPNYVTNNNRGKKIAAQLNIKAYEKIEEILENYSLYHLIADKLTSEAIKVNEAKAYYKKLRKEK